MGMQAAQEEILVPVTRFRDLTKSVVQKWIDKGRNHVVFEAVKMFPELPTAFVYLCAVLVLSLRDKIDDSSVNEGGRCAHFLMMLSATSGIIALAGKIRNLFPAKEAVIANLTKAREKFCAENGDFCDLTTGNLSKLNLPTAETIYELLFCREGPLLDTAVTNRIAWVEKPVKKEQRTYAVPDSIEDSRGSFGGISPLEGGSTATMLAIVMRDCLGRVVEDRSTDKVPAVDRRDHNTRPPSLSGGAISASQRSKQFKQLVKH